MDSDTEISDYWGDIFPYDEPYPNQIKAINRSIKTLKSSGIYLMEGPCGTGKTLIALTTGLSLVRDSSTKYERVLVITSKKQQLSAFEDDFKQIEESASKNFGGLTLIGKSELCPYVQAGLIDKDEIYHRCINLRDNTYELMKMAVEANRADNPVGAAHALYLLGQADYKENNLTVRDNETPFKTTLPEIADKEYCPFYASHITSSAENSYPLDLGAVTSGEETLKKGSKKGTCPHLEMKRMHDRATILFGNYKHCFDPATVGGMTGGIINENTLLVCDEAHSLVNNVRNQLSYSISYRTLRRSIQEINEVQRWINGKGEPQRYRLSKSILEDTPITKPDLKISAKFVNKIDSLLEKYINETLPETVENFANKIENPGDEEITLKLQNPSNKDPDILSNWINKKGYGNIWKLFLKTSKVVSVIKDVVARKVDGKSPDGSFAISNLHELMNRWWMGGHAEYYREIVLHPRSNLKKNPSETKSWDRGYRAEIRINNCIPQDEIAATIDAFGGAILMSATLSPLNIYEEVTGIKKLRNGTQPEESLVTKAVERAERKEEEQDNGMGDEPQGPNVDVIEKSTSSNKSMSEKRRKVKRSVFDITFPEENRASIAVNAPRFTYENRTPKSKDNDIRNTYARAIESVVSTTPGNVLVCMPSYEEAAWASERLISSNNTSKKVITDTSSSSGETESLKQAFFKGEGKVLATSLRGTLIEGVDFDGDKLKGVVVCGVPIKNTSTDLSSATKSAYDSRFNGKGFQYGFAVPAVRKSRQALGRVIRGSEEVGIRVLIDERYARESTTGSVREFFPQQSREEFRTVNPPDLHYELERFWNRREH